MTIEDLSDEELLKLAAAIAIEFQRRTGIVNAELDEIIEHLGDELP